MKILAYLLIILSLTFCPASTVFADDIDEGNSYVDIHPVVKQDANIAAPRLNATAAAVIDMNSGRILYEKNARIRKAMASTTKIMTAIVAIENADLEEEVTVSKRAAEINGSDINLKTGEKLKMEELLYGLMLKSGNDAAIAIAEHVGGSVEEFCEMMNRKAASLGAINTHFTSPHGLDMPEHYTTALELANITAYALRNPIFNSIVCQKHAAITNRELNNTNELLGVYPGVDGVKTGYTGQAGRCLVTSATKNQMRIITVVLGSPTRSARAQSSTSLLNYAFNNYQLNTLSLKDEHKDSIVVNKGAIQKLNVDVENSVKIPLTEDERKKLKEKISLPKEVKAPVKKGQKLGSITWELDGQELCSSTLIASEDVRRKNIRDYFIDLVEELGRLTQ